jgi:hypothetical protein
MDVREPHRGSTASARVVKDAFLRIAPTGAVQPSYELRVNEEIVGLQGDAFENFATEELERAIEIPH